MTELDEFLDFSHHDTPQKFPSLLPMDLIAKLKKTQKILIPKPLDKELDDCSSASTIVDADSRETSLSPTEPIRHEHEKKQLTKKQQNRLAAQKSRQKKHDAEKRLHAQIGSLTRRCTDLEMENLEIQKKMQRQIDELKAERDLWKHRAELLDTAIRPTTPLLTQASPTRARGATSSSLFSMLALVTLSLTSIVTLFSSPPSTSLVMLGSRAIDPLSTETEMIQTTFEKQDDSKDKWTRLWEQARILAPSVWELGDGGSTDVAQRESTDMKPLVETKPIIGRRVKSSVLVPDAPFIQLGQ
jgi:hypothetical protein